MSQTPRWFHRNYLYLTGVVSGIILCKELPAFYPAGLLSAGLTGFLLYRRCWRETVILLAALLLGALSTFYQRISEPEVLQNCYLENHPVEICDSNAVGSSRYEDDQVPYRIKAKLHYNRQDHIIQLYFPPGTPNPGVAAGEKYLVSGSFYRPQPTSEVFLADNSGQWQLVSSRVAQTGYANYLALHNISGQLTVETLERSQETPSAMTRFRQMAQERLDRGIDNADRRAMLSAITLGLRSRLTPELKHKFASTGVAHLFSISGLHVGVLALLILLALRPLPAVWHWLITGTLVFYVMATGGNAPAIRAFLLVVLLEFFHSRLMLVRTLELLSLIAAGLLVWNPLFLCDAGFQYSFVTTAFLIKVAPLAREVMQSAAGTPALLGESARWRQIIYSIRGKFCGALVYAATASLATGSLMLYHQNMFFAGSMLLNLLILPVLTPLFTVAMLKCLLPFANALWNLLLNTMLIYLESLVNWFYKFNEPGSWMRPHWLTVAVFSVLLWLFILLRKSRWSFAVLIALLMTVGFQLLQPPIQTQKIAVVICGGGLENPVMAIVQPQTHNAYMLNAGRDAVYPFKDAAAFYGINQITRLDFAYPTADCADGLVDLQRNFPIHRYRVSNKPVRSNVFKEYTLDLPLERGAKSDSLSVFESGQAELQIKPAPSGSWLLQVNDQSFELKRTANPRMYIIPLKRANPPQTPDSQ